MMLLKTDIHILGFPNEVELRDYWWSHFWWDQYKISKKFLLIYKGKIEDIPKEQAEHLCDWIFWDEHIKQRRYYNYGYRVVVSYPFTNPIDSIKSACKTNDEYCLIYRNNHDKK